MSSVSWVITCFKLILQKIKNVINLAGYNQLTIDRYFRKRGAKIGEDCYIGVRSLGMEPYLVSIGNHVWISDDVAFHTHEGGVWVFEKQNPDLTVRGPIFIEDNCFIGRGAQLLPNIRIGKNSIVGAGSVVISDVPPNSVVMGVPARPFGSLSKYEERCLARWKEQRPPDLRVKEGYHWKIYKENYAILRKHLTAMFMERDKSEKETGDKTDTGTR
jgi:acetyltransferase-like isoleucine patch superfamily enzyme